MKRHKRLFIVSGIAAAAVLLALTLLPERPELKREPRIRSTQSPKATRASRFGRVEYFQRLLRDPATGLIPENIRRRELAFARNLPRAEQRLAKGSAAQFTWKSAGPTDVGGRVRALAVDINNSNTVLAGSVSGGIWKTTDHGATWALKNTPGQNLAVTSLAQDTRSGHTGTWYYSTGEFDGSAYDRGARAFVYGAGVYKSTNGGDTWTELPWAQGDNNPTAWSYPTNYISRLAVHPANGYLFVASHAYGIFRSTDGGANWGYVHGGLNQGNFHYYADVALTSDGRVVAALSNSYWGSSTSSFGGIYVSTNYGGSWTDVTPSTFPSSHERTVLGCAPSNANIVYAMTYAGGSGASEDVRYHKIDLSNAANNADRSGNMPALDMNMEGFVHTQRNYNMILGVKPDDESFVVLGATSMFRSPDGFATQPTSARDAWIGGYWSSNPWRYPNLHPDQHVFAFDPQDGRKLWVGHDGGISYTADITQAVGSSSYLTWVDKSPGFITTQFYTVTLPWTAGDNRIMGGTQDNGTPWLTWNGSTASASRDVSSGDGCYAYFGADYGYTSPQYGQVKRYEYDASGRPVNNWTYVYPAVIKPNFSNQLFVHPYVVDPNDEDVMYYPDGNKLYRNSALSSIPKWQQGTNTGWDYSLSSLSMPTGYLISALQVSRSGPAHVLYYGASDPSNSSSSLKRPMVYRLENANTATTGVQNRSDGSWPYGAYVHDIAVNPENADEIMVVLSNYNIIGLYHSTNGGQSYTAVEGNLTGNASDPGPSMRSAAILERDGESTVYLVATSVGVFSTANLNGASTVWYQEGWNEIRNVVVEKLFARTTDGRVVAASHGLGLFVAEAGSSTLVDEDDLLPRRFVLEQNYPNPFNPETTIRYTLGEAAKVRLQVFDVRGRSIALLADGMETAGEHTVTFDGTNLPSGVYVVRLTAGNATRTLKMTLMR